MCSERSGSNLITKILNAHSNICGPNTKHVINPVARNLFRYEPIDIPENWLELLKDINELLNVNFSIWKSSFSVEKLAKLAPNGDIQTLIRNIFYEEAHQHNKQYIFVKENHLYEFLPFLLFHFPESKYIYQVRDPRDMALSWRKSPPHPGGVIQGARQWKKDQQQFLKNYNELKKKGRAAFIKYENLISHPEKETKRLVEFLGLSFEPKMLEFYKDDLTQENANKMPAWENLSNKVLADNKNKYLKELSSDEIKYIEHICMYEMQYLGYKFENDFVELEKIREEEILEFEDHEERTIPLNRFDEVKANMEAKKKFYRKSITDRNNICTPLNFMPDSFDLI